MNLTDFNWQKFCSGEIKIFDKEGHVLKIDMFGGDFIINNTHEHRMKTVEIVLKLRKKEDENTFLTLTVPE